MIQCKDNEGELQNDSWLSILEVFIVELICGKPKNESISTSQIPPNTEPPVTDQSAGIVYISKFCGLFLP